MILNKQVLVSAILIWKPRSEVGSERLAMRHFDKREQCDRAQDGATIFDRGSWRYSS
jgi:hypothetical protein